MKAIAILVLFTIGFQSFATANVPQIYQLKLQGDLIQYFLFYTTVYVGTPPVEFTVTVRNSIECT